MEKIIQRVDVVKPGTNVLTKKQGDIPVGLDLRTFRNVGRQASASKANMVIVSSAAIAAGMIAAKSQVRPNRLTEMPELQRMSSKGWRHIHNAWDESIERKETGGVLLTRQDL